MTTADATRLVEENQQLKAELRVLSLQVKELQKQLFGRRSDKRPDSEESGQGMLEGIQEGAWNEAQVPAAPKTRRPQRKGKKKGPKPLNPDLPRVSEVVDDPGLKELICPVTGKLMRVGFVESIEVLSRVPARYHVRSISRNVFVSPAGEAPVYSPWPKNVMPKSRIDTGVISSLLTGRFADHQPYHRQQGQLARFGVDLAPNTMVSLRKAPTPLPVPDQKGARQRLHPTRSHAHPHDQRQEKRIDQASVHVDLPGSGRTGVLRVQPD